MPAYQLQLNSRFPPIRVPSRSSSSRCWRTSSCARYTSRSSAIPAVLHHASPARNTYNLGPPTFRVHHAGAPVLPRDTIRVSLQLEFFIMPSHQLHSSAPARDTLRVPRVPLRFEFFIMLAHHLQHEKRLWNSNSIFSSCQRTSASSRRQFAFLRIPVLLCNSNLHAQLQLKIQCAFPSNPASAPAPVGDTIHSFVMLARQLQLHFVFPPI
jgi:hypothetical protein